ncbi:ECF RNA polymerase sigma-E factor [Phycisphaerae bacterium RAS1]|nr:ECF RNA polymerase sigma-E factor [Phycisphaerae bacterium RAS1]
MASSPDERIARAIAGDTEAASSLLREYAPRLRAQLSIDPRWQSVLDADDVLQVTFLECFLKIKSFQPGGSGAFYGWLRRIAENNLRDAVKGLEAQKRPPPAVQAARGKSDESFVALYDLLRVTSATPSRAVGAGEMAGALERALAALPADYAQIIRAYDLEGRPIAEVAAETKRSPGAIHMLRARAHDRLRELLGSPSDFFSRGA